MEFDLPKKKFCISFTKSNRNFCSSVHYNADDSYLFVNGKEIIKFKADNKNVNFSATESKEIALNRNVYDFSVGYNSTDKSDILNIHKYLMTKNSIK